MTIDRDPQIRFHELGTLQSVTRWIRTHDEGLAEWLKNARRAYQSDRADVADEDRVAFLLLHDAVDDRPARIGLLDVGGATRWSREAVVSQDEMLQAIAAHYGPVAAVGGRGSAPADRFTLPDGTTFGIIASTTRPFCQDCDRSRLTAEGLWYL